VGVNVRGGEGGIREVEKEYGGDFIHAFDERGELGVLGELVYSGIYSAPGGLRGFGLGGLGHPLMS
jgi:hypothetical protein